MNPNARRFCGYCADGHLHWFTDEGVDLKNAVPVAQVFRTQFQSHMLRNGYFEERSIEDFDNRFVSLLPRRCPQTLLDPARARTRQTRLRELPNITLAPFGSRADNSSNPALYIQNFEISDDGRQLYEDGGAQAKQNLYELIQEQMPLEPRALREMTYNELTEEFLGRFWSVEHQFITFRRFNIELGQMVRNQRMETLRDFLHRWALEFAFSTNMLSRDVIRLMVTQIPMTPAQLRFMDRYRNGVNSWLQFSKDLHEEDAFTPPRSTIYYIVTSALVITLSVVCYRIYSR